MRTVLSWYVGCLGVAWGLVLVALIATLVSPVWAGNNCQPVPQPASERIAEVGVVVAFVAVFGAGLVAINARGEPARFARRASLVLVTLAACVVVLVLGFQHAPSCPSV